VGQRFSSIGPGSTRAIVIDRSQARHPSGNRTADRCARRIYSTTIVPTMRGWIEQVK
jgi:hypothetical protein